MSAFYQTVPHRVKSGNLTSAQFKSPTAISALTARCVKPCGLDGSRFRRQIHTLAYDQLGLAAPRESKSEGIPMARTDILKMITPEQAATVLTTLAASDPEVRRKARVIARKLLGDVDVEELAEEVFWVLDAIAVEQVWDRSGRKRDGYVDPGEAAWQLLEEALEPFLDALRRCQRLVQDARLVGPHPAVPCPAGRILHGHAALGFRRPVSGLGRNGRGV